MSSTLETPLPSSNHLQYGFLGVKAKPRHSPSLSLSPPFRKKILSQRNSVFSMHNNYIDDAPRKKSKRFSVLSKEEEIDLITKTIGEKILRGRKMENLSVNSCNYTTLPLRRRQVLLLEKVIIYRISLFIMKRNLIKRNLIRK